MDGQSRAAAYLNEHQRCYASAGQLDGAALRARLHTVARASDPTQLFVSLFALYSLRLATPVGRRLLSPSVLEHLAFHLLPLTVAPRRRAVTSAELERCALDVPFLLMQAFDHHAQGLGHTPEEWLRVNLLQQREAIRGSAYAEQTQQEIADVQGAFDKAYRQLVDIVPTRALLVASTLTCLLSDRLQRLAAQVGDVDPGAPTSLSQILVFAPTDLPVAYGDVRAAEPSITEKEWAAFLRLIGLTPERALALERASHGRRRPLYILPDGRVLLPDVNALLDQLWLRYDELALGREDRGLRPAGFKDVYTKHKGKWLEKRTRQQLGALFPQLLHKVYDEDSAGETDILVRYGPYLLIVEAKATKFDSVESDDDEGLGTLYKEIRAALGRSAEQAQRVVTYLGSKPRVKFRGKDLEGQVATLAFDVTEVEHLLILNVTQHHLGDFNHQLPSLKAAGQFRGETFPVSMSLADLAVILRFCEDPVIFLHYLEQRQALLERQMRQEQVQVLASELALFGSYLDNRLLMLRDGTGHETIVSFEGQDRFDRWMWSRALEREDDTEIQLHAPAEIRALLRRFSRREDPDAVRALRMLLNAHDEEWGRLSVLLHKVGGVRLQPRQFAERKLEWHHGLIYVLLVGAPSRDLSFEVILTIRDRTRLEMYRSRKSEGLSIVYGTQFPFPVPSYHRQMWRPDPRMEEEAARSFPPPDAFGPPGRSDDREGGSSGTQEA